MRSFAGIVPRGHVAFVLVNSALSRRPLTPYWKNAYDTDGKLRKGGLLMPSAQELVRKDPSPGVPKYLDVDVFNGAPHLVVSKEDALYEFLLLSPENADSPTAKIESGVAKAGKVVPDTENVTVEGYLFYTYDPERELIRKMTEQGYLAKARRLFESKIAFFDTIDGKPVVTFLGVEAGAKKAVGKKSTPDSDSKATLRSIYTIMFGIGSSVTKYLREDAVVEEQMADQVLSAITTNVEKAEQFIKLMEANSEELSVEAQISLALASGVVQKTSSGVITYENVEIGTKAEIITALAKGAPEATVNAWKIVSDELKK